MSLASSIASRTISSGSRTVLSRVSTASSALDRPIKKSWSKAVHSCRSTSSCSSRRYSSSTDQLPPAPRQRSSFPLAAAAAASLVLVGSGYFFLSNGSGDSAVLAPDRWTSVKVTSVERLTSDTSLIRFDVPKSILPPAIIQDGDDVRPILSLYVKDPTLQIQRAYTPLSAKSFNPDGSATLELVVKRYPDGEVSRYLHRVSPGDAVEIRAPIVTWYYRPRDWDQVVFIAGGTGVTPAVQCINDSPPISTASSPSPPSSPTLSLVYASASRAQTFLRPQLDASRRSGKVSKILYHVDRLDEPAKMSDPPTVVDDSSEDETRVGWVDRESLERFVGKKDPRQRKVIIVCGPEGMINAVAGPRGRNFSQGKVGGILRELGYAEHEVVKL